jgi:hypothetical protein
LCVLALAGPGAEPVVVAHAWAAGVGECTARVGTIVAVDFAHWGGPIVRGCAINEPSGYALLHVAGFTTAGDSYDGPALICRLGDAAFRAGTQYPTPHEEPCVLTPPASAYWSYWIAPAGKDAFRYSPVGAMNDVPEPGEVQLWMFGGTSLTPNGSGVESVSPDALRTETPSPTSGAPGSPAIVNATTSAGLHTSSRSAVGLVVGICLAFVLCSGAGWAVWRRRRYE